ncbi:uncharacterized protein B0T23DRAFT_172341 [Neurospora hispaniola]|uniref:Uncharacterized protein n=1 Tax=Neurospora hispaniola TaxID=588809 RepID=A0AAJ0MQW8_9PEZI|nr:hypothetical protein B0T23DRAFT_172341 [Neurospora hispaniola]
MESPWANETHSARLVSSRRPSPTNAVRRTLPSPLTASACPSKIPTIPFQRPLGCDTLRRRRSSLASPRSKLACTSSRSSLLGPPRSSPPSLQLEPRAFKPSKLPAKTTILPVPAAFPFPIFRYLFRTLKIFWKLREGLPILGASNHPSALILIRKFQS